MPVLSYHYVTEDDYIFLGTCEYAKRNEFCARLESWCMAYNRSYDNVKTTHHYIGSLILKS